MNYRDYIDISTFLANMATFLGIPLAISVLIRDRRQAQELRELETYRALQSEYSEFLKFCLNHPNLPLHDWKPDLEKHLSPEEEKQKMVAYEILVSMFESAFFLYHFNHRSEFKRRQWTGWEEYIREWATRKDFKESWREHLGYQFDSEFVAYVNRIIKEIESAA